MAPIPYTIVPLTDEEKAARAKYYPSEKTTMVDMIKIPETECMLTAKFAELAEKIYNFEVREDDIWLITFPKAGTTWTQVRSKFV